MLHFATPLAWAIAVPFEGNAPLGGSVITTIQQMGGQVAHSITNVGPQPRTVDRVAAQALISQLKQLPPESIHVKALMGDSEAYRLADILCEILKESGWDVYAGGPSMAMWDVRPTRVTLIVKAEDSSVVTPGLKVLSNWLPALGLSGPGYVSPDHEETELRVGSSV